MYKKKVIEEFLNKKFSNKNTMKQYRSTMKNYFLRINKNPDEYIPEDVRLLEPKDRVALEDSIVNDIYTYGDSLLAVNAKPKTVLTYIEGTVRSFLKFYDINLPSSKWEEIKNRFELKHVSTSIPKKTPTRDELKYILQFADLRTKALVMLSATSGLRIDECSNVPVRPDEKRCYIDIEERFIISQRKAGYINITYCTEETQEIIQEWMKQRNKFITEKINKSQYARKKYGITANKSTNPKHFKEQIRERIDYILQEELKFLFPIDENTARSYWNRLLEKAGAPYNEKTITMVQKKVKGKFVFDEFGKPVMQPKENRHYSFHCLRRFFENNLFNSGMDKKIYDAISAHISDLDSSYVGIDACEQNKEIWKQEYDKYSSALNVFSDAEKIKDEYSGKIERLDKSNEYLIAESDAKDMRINILQKKVDKLTKQLNDATTDKDFAVQSASDESALSKKLQEEFDAKMKAFQDEMAKQYRNLEQQR